MDLNSIIGPVGHSIKMYKESEKALIDIIQKNIGESFNMLLVEKISDFYVQEESTRVKEIAHAVLEFKLLEKSEFENRKRAVTKLVSLSAKGLVDVILILNLLGDDEFGLKEYKTALQKKFSG